MNSLVNFMEGKGKNGADAFKQLEPRYLHKISVHMTFDRNGSTKRMLGGGGET